MNTLNIEKALAEKYLYKKLPKELSQRYRKFFKDNIPNFLNINGDYNLVLLTSNGTPICKGYERIVIGDYGAFIEYSMDQSYFDENYIVAPGQEYRIHDPKYCNNVKYHWYTIDDNSHIKIYYQKKRVSYADYKPGYFYISPHECTGEIPKWS